MAAEHHEHNDIREKTKTKTKKTTRYFRYVFMLMFTLPKQAFDAVMSLCHYVASMN